MAAAVDRRDKAGTIQSNRIMREASASERTRSWKGEGGRKGELAPRRPCGPRGAGVERLRGSDVLGARTLRALADGERHAVSLPHGVERGPGARGLVKEVL